jgi:hypothetical protein
LARMMGAHYRSVVCGECVEASDFVGAVDPDRVAQVAALRNRTASPRAKKCRFSSRAAWELVRARGLYCVSTIVPGSLLLIGRPGPRPLLVAVSLASRLGFRHS